MPSSSTFSENQKNKKNTKTITVKSTKNTYESRKQWQEQAVNDTYHVNTHRKQHRSPEYDDTASNISNNSNVSTISKASIRSSDSVATTNSIASTASNRSIQSVIMNADGTSTVNINPNKIFKKVKPSKVSTSLTPDSASTVPTISRVSTAAAATAAAATAGTVVAFTASATKGKELIGTVPTPNNNPIIASTVDASNVVPTRVVQVLPLASNQNNESIQSFPNIIPNTAEDLSIRLLVESLNATKTRESAWVLPLPNARITSVSSSAGNLAKPTTVNALKPGLSHALDTRKSEMVSNMTNNVNMLTSPIGQVEERSVVYPNPKQRLFNPGMVDRRAYNFVKSRQSVQTLESKQYTNTSRPGCSLCAAAAARAAKLSEANGSKEETRANTIGNFF